MSKTYGTRYWKNNSLVHTGSWTLISNGRLPYNAAFFCVQQHLSRKTVSRLSQPFDTVSQYFYRCYVRHQNFFAINVRQIILAYCVYYLSQFTCFLQQILMLLESQHSCLLAGTVYSTLLYSRTCNKRAARNWNDLCWPCRLSWLSDSWSSGSIERQAPKKMWNSQRWKLCCRDVRLGFPYCSARINQHDIHLDA